MTTHRVSFGVPAVGRPFSIEHIIPELLSADELFDRSSAIGGIMLGAWKAKVVPKSISIVDLEGKIPTPQHQVARILVPNNDGQYWLAYDEFPVGGAPNPSKASTLLRVETYKPRNPFKKPYPNITDFESINGEVTRQFEKPAAALLYFSLGEYPADRKTAAYELEGSDGIGFYENVGFQRTGNEPVEQIGSGSVRYVHLEAPSISMVTQELEKQYPWLVSKVPGESA